MLFYKKRIADTSPEVIVVKTPDSERIKAAEIMLTILDRENNDQNKKDRGVVYDELAKILKGGK